MAIVEQNSLTYKTFKNIAYNVMGYIWPMVFAIFITPIVIFHLGIKNYGIYLFIYTFLGLLGLLDIGAGTAIAKYIAQYSGQKDEASLLDFIRTANSLLVIIGSTGLIVSAIVTGLGMLAPSFFPSQFAAYSQYSIVFLIVGVTFFVTCLSVIPTSLFAALQRFDISNKIGVISVTVSSLSLLGVVLAGGSLQIIFFVQFIIAICFSFVSFYYARKIFPAVSFRFGWNRKHVKDCYSFGAISSINAIASTALASLDRIIIPFYAGPSNLTYYSVPGNITGKIPGVANTLSTITFPMASKLEGSGDRMRIEILYVRSFRLITIVSAALTVTAVAFAHKALLFWLNADFADKSTNILIILALTNFFLALFGPLSNFLLGLGKLKFLTTMSVCMGIFNAVLLLILLPLYGITGAAWAYLLSVLPVVYMFYYTERHYLALSGRKRYYGRKFFGTVITSIIVWIVDSYLLSMLAVNLWTLIIMGGVSVVLYLLLYKFLGFFEEEDWRDMELFYRQTMRRLKLSKS
jgi:O-antigen/teichoic acid export membrane protein